MFVALTVRLIWSFVCVLGTDYPRDTGVHEEEDGEDRQQAGASRAVLPVLLLLVPREVHEVYQQERLHTGAHDPDTCPLDSPRKSARFTVS